VSTIYLDVCCLNRPFDDQTQARIHLEAEAILVILNQCQAGHLTWISSDVVTLEIERTPDPERRRRVGLLAASADRMVRVGASEREHALRFEAWGILAFDALHLACAECAGADVFLTTDDALLRKCHTMNAQLRTHVENPLAWLSEVSE
jgi:predicted nucleic acid-binding protein